MVKQMKVGVERFAERVGLSAQRERTAGQGWHGTVRRA